MRNWTARLLALPNAVAVLLAVSGPVAMADGDEWDDDYSGDDFYGWYYYHYGDDDWGDG